MPIKIYKEKKEALKSKLVGLSKSDSRFSILRLLYFISAIALAIYLFQIHFFWCILFLYFAIYLFAKIVKRHNAVRVEKKLCSKEIELINKEIRGLQENIFDFYGGDKYVDISHSYSSDLDIFGKDSLFQHLNRCSTSFGLEKLASVLKNGLPDEKIRINQQAIEELSLNLNWRQRLTVLSETDFALKDNENWLRWLTQKEPPIIRPILLIVLPILCFVLFFALLKILPWHLALLAFLPTAWISLKNRPKIDIIHRALSEESKQLKAYANSIEHIEKEDFSSELLIELQKTFVQNKIKASAAIRTLDYFTSQLDLRYNVFTVFLNLGFLWDHYWCYRIRKWKIIHHESVQKWFEVLGKFECLNSLAGFSFNQADFSYPEIVDRNQFSAIEIGHPLLHSTTRICNDFSMPSIKHIKIVTGSNMGGKSTFLRTIGINAVLAYCGAKVCAKSLKLPVLQIYTSMRTIDALNENTSSFYAELKRLKMVLEAVKNEENAFFLLDEILKGTNSKDRHSGAVALIKQLLKHEGAGLISTHDLALGNMEIDDPSQIEAICFEVEAKGDQLVFDYTLRKGVSKSFNATQLMRNMGIEL